MSRRSTPERQASRSGSYVHETQRHTERVVLRVSPTVAAELRRRKAESGLDISAIVSALVLATSR